MHQIKCFILFSLVLLVSRCSETTTKTNNPIIPPENTEALINFVSTQSDTSIEAYWWVKVVYDEPVLGPYESYIYTGERKSAFHIPIDLAKMESDGSYPTGEVKYCAVLSGSAKNWKSITVIKGDNKTVIVALYCYSIAFFCICNLCRRISAV